MSRSLKIADATESSKIWLEKAIKNRHIKVYPYEQFEDIVKVGEGGFGIILKSSWKTFGLTVAIKRIKKLDNKELIQELKNLQEISRFPNIVDFYGVTQDPADPDGSYSIVLQFAEQGNLRTFLSKNFSTLSWADKLRISREVARGLKNLHEHDIVHRDLNTYNILVHEGSILITDFGLARRIDQPYQSMEVRGLIAYIDPQCFSDTPYKLPFEETKPIDIISLVLNGERENPAKNVPDEYVTLYEKCWDSFPEIRPNIKDVLEHLNRPTFEMYEEAPSNIIDQEHIARIASWIGENGDFGPCFGFNDLTLKSSAFVKDKWFVMEDNYEYPIRPSGGSFEVKDYEVFEILDSDSNHFSSGDESYHNNEQSAQFSHKFPSINRLFKKR
ncbi:13343_t:CDS:2 [Acaulospora morrowiae]|uniref:13343_t:CDS:1 n=1 Tax=Acaulospora morrowiae TaxID=94023 RepID=A0A9N8VU74_9GLOM|nr:13343_t:CDS:2 [Acaulospora morrowiae]